MRQPIAAPNPKGSQRVADQIADPAEFFVPPPSDQGANLQGRVAYDMKYLIASAVASRETPFMTESDFVRTAAWWFWDTCVAPKLGGKFAQERKRFNEYVASMQRKAALLDWERFVNTSQDVILKLWKIGAKDEAADHYEGMMREAKEISRGFHAHTVSWAKTNPKLKEVRVYVKSRKAAAQDEP